MNSEIQSSSLTKTDEISLKDLLLKIKDWYAYLLSKWVLVLIGILIGILLGLAFSFFKKPKYTASTTFVLEEGEKSGGLSQYSGLASMVGINLGNGAGGIFEGDNILELYKSRTMIENALLTKVDFNGKKELLIDRYIDMNELREKWKDEPWGKSIQFNTRDSTLMNGQLSRLQDSIIGSIVVDINKKYLKVDKPDKKLSIMKADVISNDELFSKAFNEQIVKKVNDFYIRTKTKRSLENVVILQQKTDSVKAEMNGAIYAAAAITDATPNLNPTRQAQRVAPFQRSQFSAETNKAILGELVKNLEMSKISLRKEAPLIQIIDSPILPLEESKFGFIKGFVFGGFLGGFLTCLFLTVKRFLRIILT